MNAVLGGPGVACSALRVRRLAAGELGADERARTEAHVAACPRCRGTERELALERARLEAELPFEAFAAGVAEKLAAPARRRLPRAAALALAASVAFAFAVPSALRVAGDRQESRVKGAAAIELYVRDGADARLLSPGEPVPAGGALRVGIAPAERRYAAVALVDADGAVVLHAGPAEKGVLPGAFEWTGSGEGSLVLVLDDVPVDAAALADRLARGGAEAASPGGRAEVVVRPIARPSR
jgi:hypothetical protein